MIERSRCPLSSGGGPITEDVAALWEGWMWQVDELLSDEKLVELVYEALARRWTHSRTRGRRGSAISRSPALPAGSCLPGTRP